MVSHIARLDGRDQKRGGTMKVILTKPVADLGSKGDVVEVSDGSILLIDGDGDESPGGSHEQHIAGAETPERTGLDDGYSDWHVGGRANISNACSECCSRRERRNKSSGRRARVLSG